MKKRILAALLTLVMALSLLPVSALAAAGDPATDGGAAATEDKLHFEKKATLDSQTGEITVRMEAWATGEVTTSTSTEVLDIALVLDVSGSMKEDFIQEESKFVPVYESGLNKEETYYVKPALFYHEVSYCDECGTWTRGCVRVLGIHIPRILKYTPKTSENDKRRTQFYEYQYTPGQSKIDALKGAVNSFIDDVAKKSPNSQIAIVKFAGDKSDSVGNDTYGSYGYNCTQIVKPLTKVNTNGVTALKDAVSALNYGGATAADYGMEKAQAALSNASHKKVVVLFTDGEPNHQNGFDYSVAAATINTAKEMKTDTTIYTIGVFKEQDGNVDKYMSSTSSNYPNASATTSDEKPYWSVTEGGSDLGNYYKKVNNADDLLKAFETISSEVTPGTALGNTAVLTDVIAPNCSLVAPEGTNGITAYTVDKTAEGWSESRTDLTSGVTVNDGTVQVTGFDYSANCVTDKLKPNTSADYGKKLVVEFKVQNNNYGGTQPTNDGAAIKDASGSTVKSVDNPTVPAPVKLPRQTADYTVSKVYDGEGYDIKANIADLVTGLVSVNGTNNKYIDLAYEIKDSTGAVVGTYTISAGRTTGTWADGTGDIKTAANVGDYTYTVTVTGTDKSDANNFGTKNYTAKFSITACPLEITANSASKSYDGQKLTASGYTLTDNTSLATGDTIESVTVSGEVGPDAGSGTSTASNAVIKRGDTDVTTNYAITYKSGTLTITDSSSTATVTFKIVGGTWNDGGTDDKTAQVTLTNGAGTLAGVTIPAGEADNDHEGEGVWKDASGNEVALSTATTITGNTVYTLTFKFKEIVPPAEKHTLTINYVGPVGDNEFSAPAARTEQLAEGETYNVTSPEVSGYTPDTPTVSGTMGAENVTVTVTYTKNTAPDTILGVLNKYVWKQFDSTYGYSTSATFTVDVTVYQQTVLVNSSGAAQQPAVQAIPQNSRVIYTGTGTVTLSTGSKAQFQFKGEDVSLVPYGDYMIVLREQDANLAYVTCDTTEHSYAFAADEHGQKTLEDIVIVNSYDYYVPFIPVNPTPSKPALNTDDHYAYIVGYPDGTVRPNGSITRAEAATIFFRLLTDAARSQYWSTTNAYSDVAAGSWYNNAVSTMSSAGIVNGYPDGTFRPDAPITRAEMAKMISLFAKLDKTEDRFTDIAGHWAEAYIKLAAGNGWIEGYPDGSFRPQQSITRAETVTMINRVLERVPSTISHLLPYSVMQTYPDCVASDWYYIAIQEATNSHTYERAATEKNGDEQWIALRANRDWTELER